MTAVQYAVAPPSPGRPTLAGSPVIGLVFRLVLAGVLGFAGISKLLAPSGAREAIVAYRVPGMTGDLASLAGWVLPAGEVLLAVMLLVGLFTRLAAIVTAGLMLAFIVGIVSVWMRGYSIDCGCFGGGGDVSEAGRTWRYTSEILRDLLFTGMAVWLIRWPTTRLSLDGDATTSTTRKGSTDEHQ